MGETLSCLSKFTVFIAFRAVLVPRSDTKRVRAHLSGDVNFCGRPHTGSSVSFKFDIRYLATVDLAQFKISAIPVSFSPSLNDSIIEDIYFCIKLSFFKKIKIGFFFLV